MTGGSTNTPSAGSRRSQTSRPSWRRLHEHHDCTGNPGVLRLHSRDARAGVGRDHEAGVHAEVLLRNQHRVRRQGRHALPRLRGRGRRAIRRRRGARVRPAAAAADEVARDVGALESDPPRRLVQGWRSLYAPELADEETSRVTWEIEPKDGGITLLTVVHDRLEGAPKTAASVSGEGWMFVLSGLK